jgi:hypothetical protein
VNPKPTYTELQQMVRGCLWQAWDPIGVNGSSEATDEYDAYAPTIAAMLLDGADAIKVLEHLKRLETDSMGLSPHYTTAEAVTQKLLAMVGR